MTLAAPVGLRRDMLPFLAFHLLRQAHHDDGDFGFGGKAHRFVKALGVGVGNGAARRIGDDGFG